MTKRLVEYIIDKLRNVRSFTSVAKETKLSVTTVLDILPERYSYYLSKYFNSYSKDERNQVKFFVSDMWKTYSDISDTWLKNAVKIVDKYHWIRQAIWAFEKIRKEEQKKLGTDLRKYFKRSKSLLMKRFDSLKDEEKSKLMSCFIFLLISVELIGTKRSFYKSLTAKIPTRQKKL